MFEIVNYTSLILSSNCFCYTVFTLLYTYHSSSLLHQKGILTQTQTVTKVGYKHFARFSCGYRLFQMLFINLLYYSRHSDQKTVTCYPRQNNYC